jgi:hypothetical protein
VEIHRLQLDLAVYYYFFFEFIRINIFFYLAALSVRHAHTDIQIPNFDYYRRKARHDASKSYRDAGDATSPYSYLTPIGKHSLHHQRDTIPIVNYYFG